MTIIKEMIQDMVEYMSKNPDVEIVAYMDSIAPEYKWRALSSISPKTWTITDREIREASSDESWIVNRYLTTPSGRIELITGLRVSTKTYKGPEPVARTRFDIINDD